MPDFRTPPYGQRMTDEKTYSRLRRMLLSQRDFSIASSAATFLLEDVDEDLRYNLADLRRFRCYETAMVVAYARPFSMAKGAVHPLKKRDVGLSGKHPFNPMHERLISYRNTIFGHSDADHVSMAVWSITPFDERPDIAMTLPRFDEGMVFTLAEVRLISDAIYTFLAKIVETIIEVEAPFRDRFHRIDD